MFFKLYFKLKYRLKSSIQLTLARCLHSMPCYRAVQNNKKCSTNVSCIPLKLASDQLAADILL